MQTAGSACGDISDFVVSEYSHRHFDEIDKALWENPQQLWSYQNFYLIVSHLPQPQSILWTLSPSSKEEGQDKTQLLYATLSFMR